MYDDLPSIEHTVDAAGYVLVNGERVLNVPGAMLKHQAMYTAMCQRCHEPLDKPLRVVSEYESAIETVRYFHAPVPGTSNVHETCPPRQARR